MKNRIIAGDYQGWNIALSSSLFSKPKFYFTKTFTREEVSKATVARYDIVDRNNVSSFGRAFVYGAVGQALFGPVGMLAGILGGNKGRQSFVISIELNNGKKALLEVDERTYKEILRVLY